MKKPHIVRHGEVILQQIDTLPAQATVLTETHEEIVAHSETGHHHILEVTEKTDMTKMKFYTWNGETYVHLPAIASLWHKKTGTDMHTPHIIIPGFYKITIKQSFNYFSKAMERVRD